MHVLLQLHKDRGQTKELLDTESESESSHFAHSKYVNAFFICYCSMRGFFTRSLSMSGGRTFNVIPLKIS